MTGVCVTIRCKCCRHVMKTQNTPVIEKGYWREVRVWLCDRCEEPCTNGLCRGKPPLAGNELNEVR